MAKRSISTEPFLWALFGARGLLAHAPDVQPWRCR